MAIRPNLYTISGLQAETGVSARKLGEVLATVSPDGGTEKRPTWLMKTALQAIEASEGRGLNPQAEKARLDKARADIAEIELEKRRGDVVSLTAATQVWSNMFVNLKTKMRAIPTKAAPLMAAELSAETCKDILNRFVDEALSELAENPDYGQAEGAGGVEEGGYEPEASSAPDGERVG